MAQEDRGGLRRVAPLPGACPDLTFDFGEVEQPQTKTCMSPGKQPSRCKMLNAHTHTYAHTRAHTWI